MTLDLYGHLFLDETERLAERMDRARSAVVARLQQATATRTVAPLRSGASG